MIEINLMPEEMRKGGRAKSRPQKAKAAPGTGISPLVPLVFILMLGGTVAAGFVMVKPFFDIQQELKDITEKEETLSRKVSKKAAELEELAKLEEVVNKRLKVLRSLDPDDRLYWAEKLNIISDTRLKNIFIERINLAENVQEIETLESKQARQAWNKKRKKNSKAAGKEPKKQTRPLITQTMTIYGICEPEDPNRDNWVPKAQENFLKFLNVLQTHKVEDQGISEEIEYRLTPFSSNFKSIDPGLSWDATKEILKHKVLKFQIIIITQPILKYDDDEEGMADNDSDE